MSSLFFTEPAYCIGFINPQTKQKVFVRTIVEHQAEGMDIEIFEFANFGREFPSKTQAKKYLRQFRLNFSEYDYQHQMSDPDYANLPLSCYDIKVASQLFDMNEEMLKLNTLSLISTHGSNYDL